MPQRIYSNSNRILKPWSTLLMIRKRIGAVVMTAIALALPANIFAQMTMDQKTFDIQALASLYAKRYAPHDWKKQLFNNNQARLGRPSAMGAATARSIKTAAARGTLQAAAK